MWNCVLILYQSLNLLSSVILKHYENHTKTYIKTLALQAKEML